MYRICTSLQFLADTHKIRQRVIQDQQKKYPNKPCLSNANNLVKQQQCRT